MDDGRLLPQASRLILAPLRPVYIFEGTAVESLALKVRRPALEGAIFAHMLIFDIPALQSNDPAETAHLLRYIGQQLHRAQTDRHLPNRQIKAERRSTRQLR